MAVFCSFHLHSSAFPGNTPAIVCKTRRLNKSILSFFRVLAQYLPALVLPQQPGGCYCDRSSCASTTPPLQAKFCSDTVCFHLHQTIPHGGPPLHWSSVNIKVHQVRV